MFKYLVMAIIGLLLAGCASTYTPSSTMLQIKQGMSKQIAATTIAKYMKQTPESGGYCGGNKFQFDPGTPLTVTPEGYTLRAYKAGKLLNTEEVGKITKYTYEKVYYEDGRKFANIVKIRVMPGAPPIGSGGCTITGTTGYSLSIHYGTSDIDVIHVGNAGVDELLAALTTLAPQAKLIQGIGL